MWGAVAVATAGTSVRARRGHGYEHEHESGYRYTTGTSTGTWHTHSSSGRENRVSGLDGWCLEQGSAIFFAREMIREIEGRTKYDRRWSGQVKDGPNIRVRHQVVQVEKC